MSEGERQSVFADGEEFLGYRIERLLGLGGLGAVYLVRHAMLDTLYALKVMYPDVALREPSYVSRFLREAKLATRIRHPNLVAVHDCGYDPLRGIYYLVMDYVEGGDLREAIALSGTIEPRRAVEIVAHVASALDAAQKFQVVHRDIKPENIMIQPDGTVKLVDLGIAKADALGDSVKTTAGNVFGTPSYISPEQAVSAKDVDTRADIYSLGIVLFEMVTGRCPYEGDDAAKVLMQVMSSDPMPDARDFKPDLPPMLAALIRRMCVKDRDRRIPTPAALLAEFARFGYAVEGATGAKAEYMTSVDAETAPALPVDIDRLPTKVDHTLSFETEDVEVREFVSQLKARRRNRRLLLVLVPIAVFALVATVFFLICR